MRASPFEHLSERCRQRIFAIVQNPDDRYFLTVHLAKCPRHLQFRFLEQWRRVLIVHGLTAANRFMLDRSQHLFEPASAECGPRLDAGDDEVVDAAAQAVRTVCDQLRVTQDDVQTRQAMQRTAERYKVPMPNCKGIEQVCARMSDELWWRRALRKRFQTAEHLAIVAGAVHRLAAPFVSDEAMRRHAANQRRVARMMERLEAVNLESGETLSMAEVREHSFANPAVRRAAMMVQIRGMEAFAADRGYIPLFLTLTCPSRMHARHSATGEANEAFDERHSPKTAQRHLRRVWNVAGRALDHHGIGRFGVRVAEPHHDGTPHWHVLVFVDAAREVEFVETMRAYALRDTPNEPGATDRRMRVERIDPTKGSAAGYVAKYVSKNIDGVGVGEEHEAGKHATKTALRASTWARIWNIRQFQFFGVGAITPFRELYRINDPDTQGDTLVAALIRAAREGDFGAYLDAQRALGTPARLFFEPRESQRYPGELTRKLRGVVIDRDCLTHTIVTRSDDWEIRERATARADRIAEQQSARREALASAARAKSAAALPWTRFNNSARVDSKGDFRATIEGAEGQGFYISDGAQVASARPWALLPSEARRWIKDRSKEDPSVDWGAAAQAFESWLHAPMLRQPFDPSVAGGGR